MARWDIEAIEDLPSYVQIIFRNLWEIIQDIEREMSSLGRHCGVKPTIDEVRKCNLLDKHSMMIYKSNVVCLYRKT